MPTPSEDPLPRPIPVQRTSYTSCPPDSASIGTADEWRITHNTASPSTATTSGSTTINNPSTSIYNNHHHHNHFHHPSSSSPHNSNYHAAQDDDEDSLDDDTSSSARAPLSYPLSPSNNANSSSSSAAQRPGRTDHHEEEYGDGDEHRAKPGSLEEEQRRLQSQNLDAAASPMSVVSDGDILHKDSADQCCASPEPDLGSAAAESFYSSDLSSEATGRFMNIPRLRPGHTSSFLRAGSRFTGTQQSDKQVYRVEVEIKNVDFDESFLCGYLRIEGLTEDHPTLTTYFEGEIIGPKYTFLTHHESWGATEKTDMQHWGRFSAWRPLAKQAKKPDFHYKNPAQRENVFMRWKEFFLVPDHRVREIFGASFEGFYYICFNQVSGNVSGIYFHAKSEKFQQLELSAVPTFGCHPAVEFR